MAKQLNFSICKTDLDNFLNSGSEAINIGKNHKEYINGIMFIEDEVSQYGTVGTLKIKTDEGFKIVGNLKEPKAKP